MENAYIFMVSEKMLITFDSKQYITILYVYSNYNIRTFLHPQSEGGRK